MREIKLLKKPVFWLVLVLILTWVAIYELPDNRLHLVFCDVGQGDATLISYRSTQVLIDGGPNDRVLTCLSDNLPFWDRTIEMVVLTHPQADHSTGLVDVIERYNVQQFVVNSIVNDTAGFWEFRKVVLEEGAQIYSPKTGDKIRLGLIQFLILWPKEKLGNKLVWQTPHLGGEVLGAATISGDLNDTSVVLKLSFGNFCALFAGDISDKIDFQLDRVRPCQVLKVAHHGSKYSTSEEFLKQIQPELAVISVGKNRFGHPTEEVIKRLRELEIKILRTDQEGEVEVVSDGKRWGVKR